MRRLPESCYPLAIYLRIAAPLCPVPAFRSDHPSVLRHVTACYESISRLEASIKCKIIFIGFKFREAFINSGKAVLEVRFEIDLMFKLLSLQFFYYIIYF